MNLKTALDEYPAFRLAMKRTLLKALTSEFAGDIPEQPDVIIPFRPCGADEYIRLITRMDDCLEQAQALQECVERAEPGALTWLLGEHTEINDDNIPELLERADTYRYDPPNPERDSLLREGWMQSLSAASIFFSAM